MSDNLKDVQQQMEQYIIDRVKDTYGYCSSFAIWCNEDKKPKENIGDLSCFSNIYELSKINKKYILVGLNISKQVDRPFGNFHGNINSSNRYGNDFKLRYALRDTILYGSYITDIIKDFEQKISGKVMKYLKSNQEFELDNINTFRNEIKCLEIEKPILIAMGNDVYNILSRHFKNEYTIIKIPHYAMRSSKEKYRKTVLDILQQHNL
jgi:hypothetical protein